MARPRSRRIASEDSDSGNSKDVGKKAKQKGASTTRKKKESTFVVSIPKTRVKLPSAEARAPRKLIIHNTSSSSSSPLPPSTTSYVNRPSFPSGHLSFKKKDYQVSRAVHFSEFGHCWLRSKMNNMCVRTYVATIVFFPTKGTAQLYLMHSMGTHAQCLECSRGTVKLCNQ